MVLVPSQVSSDQGVARLQLLAICRVEDAVKVDQKRTAVRAAYEGKKWQVKVDKMSDDQVIAIYSRLKDQGKV